MAVSTYRTKTPYGTGGPRDFSAAVNRMKANGAKCFGAGPKVVVSRVGAQKGQGQPESSVTWS